MILATLASALLLVSAAPVQASSSTAAPSAPTLAWLVGRYPGSTVVAPDTIRIAPGVLLSLPTTAAKNSTNSEKVIAKAGGSWNTCTYKYLCLFSEARYSGYKLSLYNCGFVDLGRIDFPGGGKWNDKMSSFVNNQTNDTKSSFYNWDGQYSWDIATLYDDGTGVNWFYALSYLANLGDSNDQIDGARVC